MSVKFEDREIEQGHRHAIASKALAVQTLLGLDRSGEDHGEGDEGVDGELHFEGGCLKWCLEVEEGVGES